MIFEKFLCLSLLLMCCYEKTCSLPINETENTNRTFPHRKPFDEDDKDRLAPFLKNSKIRSEESFLKRIGRIIFLTVLTLVYIFIFLMIGFFVFL